MPGYGSRRKVWGIRGYDYGNRFFGRDFSWRDLLWRPVTDGEVARQSEIPNRVDVGKFVAETGHIIGRIVLAERRELP
jgi:hypothetical protein